MNPGTVDDARMAREHGPRTLKAAATRFFTFASPRFLGTQLLLALGARAFFGAPTTAELVAIVGVVIYWPLQEWFFHWQLLHWKPRYVFGVKLDPHFAKVHRYHHAHPWDLATSLLPLRVVLSIAPFHVLFWWAVMPDWAGMATGVAAFTAATLVYEWIHYLTHTPYRPTSRYFRTVRRNHRMHHFRNEHFWHSFTAPFLDRLFGTGPDPRDVPRSATCHNRGVID